MNRPSIGAALWRLVRSKTGQDLMEYALLAALIVVVAIASVEAVGQTIKTVFWDAIAALDL
jgi:Flp pilus assembly pilin Flp